MTNMTDILPLARSQWDARSYTIKPENTHAAV